MENTFSAATSASERAPSRTSKVEFTGQAGEFFGIWIVNLLLSIVTLGIYSAWAKVRTNQYFYGHTRIEQQSFRYLATPMQILRGRIIAVVIFALYFVLSSLAPLFGVLLALAFIFVMPWLIVQSLKFNLRMTSYRNVRLAFHGSYGGAFKYFVLLPFLTVFTLYLALPWALKKMDSYLCSNISYGGKKMQVNTATGSYYSAAFIAFAAAIGIFVLFGILSAIGISVFGSDNAGPIIGSFGIGFILMYWLAIMVSGAIYQSMIRNHLFNNTEIPQLVRFNSTMQVLPYLLLTASNMLAIIFTLGLAYPWAKIRKAAYMASVTELTIQSAADSLIDEVQQANSSFGEEAVGLFDVDVSLA